jgi:transposase
MTCWRRVRDWQAAGVWERLHRLLLEELHAAGQIDWERAAVDGSHVWAMRGGEHTGRSPVDGARSGSKHHVIVEGRGIPLAESLTGGNRHDCTQLFALLEAIPRVRGRGRGRPRSKPKTLYADRGYDFPVFRRRLRHRGIQPKIAKRGVPHGSGLGKVRYVVERTFAWLHGMRRLRTRYERRTDIHEAFLNLGICIIALRHVICLC